MAFEQLMADAMLKKDKKDKHEKKGKKDGDAGTDAGAHGHRHTSGHGD